MSYDAFFKGHIARLEADLAVARHLAINNAEGAAEAATRNAQLSAELAALRKDAERYRWLREAKSWPAAFASCSAPEPLAKTELDAAIDAMQEAP